MFHPGYACLKTGEPALDMLWKKHPDNYAPSSQSLDAYSSRPTEMVFLELMEYTVIEVYWSLSGGAGLGGTDSVRLQHWTFCFGEACGKLRLIVAEFVE